MKSLFTIIAVLLAIMITSLCFAVPTLTIPAVKNVGANMVTLILQSNENGTGSFTINTGSNVNCGDGTKVAFGPYSSGSYHGSLPVFANVTGNYTVRNLTQDTAYTACFTAYSSSGSNLNQSPVFANISTNSAKTFTTPGWGLVGNTGVSNGSAKFTSLAIAPDGTPYVAFQDGYNSGKVTVNKFTGSDWYPVGNAGFSAGQADFVSLAFSPAGIPYVAFQDYGNSNKAIVRKYNQTLDIWDEVGSSGASAGQADYISLAFANDGTPHVAFVDYENPTITVKKFTGSTWVNLGSTGLPGDAAFISLAFSSDGIANLAYSDWSTTSKATVSKYTGSEWVAVGAPEFSSSVVNSTSLAFSPNGIPYVAYRDDGNTSKATVMKYSTNGWESVGIPQGVSSGGADLTSLAFAPDGNPCVAYQDWANGNKATVMKFNGSSWSNVGSTGFSAGRADYTSLAFSSDGTPYIAFVDASSGSTATVMKLGNKPTITGSPVTTAIKDEPYSFTPTATDATSFSIANTPSWATFNTATGALTGTPSTPETYSDIAITANNSYGSASLDSFSITVSPAGGSGSVKLASNVLYPTIADALTAAAASDTLKILLAITPEAVDCKVNKVITLEGGYDASWNRPTDVFAKVSSINITSGTLIIDQIEVQ